MGRRIAISGFTLTLVAALTLGALAGSAAAAVKGTLHVDYDASGTFKAQDNLSSLPSTSDATITWKVTADIPLAGSQVPYRYTTRNSKKGTITANANWTNGQTSCSGPLTVVESNGLQYVAEFEFEYAKKGPKFLDKGTLKGPSPVPMNTTFVGYFTEANGTGCMGYGVGSIGGSPDDPDGNVLLKVDLAKLAKSKSKSQTFVVGFTKTYNQSATTDVDWRGTVVVTLKK